MSELEDLRPEIRLSQELHETIDAAAGELCRDASLFERDHALVTVIETPTVEGRAPIAAGTPVIREVSPPTVSERLTRIVKFVRAAKPTAKEVALQAAGGPAPQVKWARCQPPPSVVSGLLARGSWPIPTLVGISETPIFRPDGSLHETPGYDSVTGYYYAPSCEIPPIPETPTQAEASVALNELEDAFVDFPHVSRADKLVPVAAILTLLAKTAIQGSVPLFVLDAATRGSGKTLQADVISLVALGRDAGRLTHPETDEELEKILASYAIAGNRLILIDNIVRPLGGGPLDKVLTTRSDVELRVLGSSEIRRLPWTATMLASGNNVQLGDDTMRRTLVSRLESTLENPETRTGFKHDPLHAWVERNRPRLLRAAFIVLRAFAVRGFPALDVPRWGSFDPWTRLIAGAIRFAGGDLITSCKPNPAERSEPERNAIHLILKHLPALAEGKPIRVAKIIAKLYPPYDGPSRPEDSWDELREAIEEITRTKSGFVPIARTLGEKIGRAKGRVIDGKRLRFDTQHGGSAYWFVETADGRPVLE